ncbi:MAG: hypothetical protein KDE09_21385 [Anaerolineales bacterium]|nr:hypothetical protein [Anaerolineales bacterium]
MKRWFTLLFLSLLAGIALVAVGNAPRLAEARAHEAAAQALEAQATVTGLAVGGLVLVTLLLAVALMAIIALLGWLLWRQRLPHPTHGQPGIPAPWPHYANDFPAGYPHPLDDHHTRQRRRRSRRLTAADAPAGFDVARPPYASPVENLSTSLPDWQTWEERPWDFEL